MDFCMDKKELGSNNKNKLKGFLASDFRSAMITGPVNSRCSPGCGRKDSRCWATARMARVEKGKWEMMIGV
jgi:hypothetical protein